MKGLFLPVFRIPLAIVLFLLTRKMRFTEDSLVQAYTDLGWDMVNDDIVVELAGTQVSGIDVGEVYNEKWQSPIGTRKYNKDAFIVIKNLSRTPFEPSKPNPDLKARHAE